MSRTLNKVQLIGRLGGPVELRRTNTSNIAVASFSLATNTPVRNQDGTNGERPEWHNIVAWDKLAETCNTYLTTGSQVYIEGRIKYRSYEDREGKTVFRTEIIASQMIMLDTNPRSSSTTQDDTTATTAASGSYEEDMDDIPFLQSLIARPHRRQKYRRVGAATRARDEPQEQSMRQQPQRPN